MTRTYDVAALSIRIVYNEFGDHDPEGMMYVLAENEAALKAQVAANPLRTVPLAGPLVLRANEGDEVVVNLRNDLPFPVSINVKGLPLNPLTGDGSFVGENPSSLVPPGETRSYSWLADREGTYQFSDLGNPASSENGSNVHGLFGAMIVEARGSTWTDPETGLEGHSGTSADVHHPLLPDFREYVVFFHDEPEIKDKDGNQPVSPETGQPESTMPITYRSEPMRNRLRLILDGTVDPTLVGEEVHHDSWTFGDPATQVLRAYRGDPWKMRLVHGGIKETHVFHLHVHQWKADPVDPDSTVIDSITISPQQSYNIEPLYGAGSYQQAYGDVIWHCHLYPHFAEGMWGIFRSHDVLEDGTRHYPDGMPIRRLMPLPDRTPPPSPSPERLGFPLFVPGTVGTKAPRPPLNIIGPGSRTPTQDEINQFDPRAVPGAVYVNPAPDGTPVRRFELSAIQLPLTYNGQGWNDPEGRIFVLNEDKEAVLNGEKPAVPFVPRVNAGEVFEMVMTNELPEEIGLPPFQLRMHTPECGMHVHLVKFDPMTADGANVGWNYDSSVNQGQTFVYRWYADTELQTIFFHDHLFANVHQQHGLFGGGVAEPAGSTYHDPVTGDPVRVGTEVMVRNPIIPSFREFNLAVHDFSLLFDKDGNGLNPPPFVGSPDDPGVMGVNYRNEPFQFRTGDPAYVFSSYVHGDPFTPVFQAYAGDPIRIRLIDGSHEEQHVFNVNGLYWRKHIFSPKSPLVSSQTFGVSEAFNLALNAGGDAEADRDHLWYFGGGDDLWLGLWGLIRVWGQEVSGLKPLPGRPVPPARTRPVASKTGSPPPLAAVPAPPVGATVWDFSVHTLQRKILYNAAGDNDPDGLFYVLEEDLPLIAAGANPRPLVLRANEGDFVRVNLVNRLPAELREVEHPGVPVGADWPPSLRVSLHPHLLAYDPAHSDGAVVGFNPDQTAGRGETVQYLWEAVPRVGPSLLSGFSDLRNHRLHGMWAGLVVEARGSSWTGLGGRSQEQAAVFNPVLPDTREFVLFQHDGCSLFDAEGNRIPDPEDPHGGGSEETDGADGPNDPGEPEGEERLDFEDQGHRAFSYRSESFTHRLAVNPDISDAFSSLVHGDPATPLYIARLGEPVTMHLLFPSDKPRNHALVVHGHRWLGEWTNPWTSRSHSLSGTSPGFAATLMFEGGAGGLTGVAADYLYRSGIVRWDIEDGMWGIMRVIPTV
jgi:FtsP/CotA-like multicopper oxidase with cupredoxin domain